MAYFAVPQGPAVSASRPASAAYHPPGPTQFVRYAHPAAAYLAVAAQQGPQVLQAPPQMLTGGAQALQNTTLAGLQPLQAQPMSQSLPHPMQTPIHNQNQSMPQTLQTPAMPGQGMQTLQPQVMQNQAMQNQAMQNQAMQTQAMQNQALQNQAMQTQAMQAGQALQNQAIQGQNISSPGLGGAQVVHHHHGGASGHHPSTSSGGCPTMYGSVYSSEYGPGSFVPYGARGTMEPWQRADRPEDAYRQEFNKFLRRVEERLLSWFNTYDSISSAELALLHMLHEDERALAEDREQLSQGRSVSTFSGRAETFTPRYAASTQGRASSRPSGTVAEATSWGCGHRAITPGRRSVTPPPAAPRSSIAAEESRPHGTPTGMRRTSPTSQRGAPTSLNELMEMNAQAVSLLDPEVQAAIRQKTPEQLRRLKTTLQSNISTPDTASVLGEHFAAASSPDEGRKLTGSEEEDLCGSCVASIVIYKEDVSRTVHVHSVPGSNDACLWASGLISPQEADQLVAATRNGFELSENEMPGVCESAQDLEFALLVSTAEPWSEMGAKVAPDARAQFAKFVDFYLSRLAVICGRRVDQCAYLAVERIEWASSAEAAAVPRKYTAKTDADVWGFVGLTDTEVGDSKLAPPTLRVGVISGCLPQGLLLIVKNRARDLDWTLADGGDGISYVLMVGFTSSGDDTPLDE